MFILRHYTPSFNLTPIIRQTDALFATICKGCDTQCSNCSLGGKEPRCLEELEHSSSTGGNTKLESLQIKPGYWRSTNRSLDIKACYNQQACLGGLTREDGYCREGYEGPCEYSEYMLMMCCLNLILNQLKCDLSHEPKLDTYSIVDDVVLLRLFRVQ